MRSTVRRRVLLPAAGVMVLGGCGDTASGHDSAAGTSPVDARCQRVADAARWEGVVQAGAKTTTLDEHDDYFSPTCIRVPWNKSVWFVVTNLGHMFYIVIVDGMSVDIDVDSGRCRQRAHVARV